MPPLTDPERLAAYADALGNWSVSDFIQFDLTEQSYRWIRGNLGIPLRDISYLMYAHVAGGGVIDEQPETRPIWSDQWEFHWDLRFWINGMLTYIETRLNYRLPVVPDESWILVVNVHAP